VVERTRLNDFAYWRSLDTRLAELLGRRASIANVGSPTPVAQVAQVVQIAQEQRELV